MDCANGQGPVAKQTFGVDDAYRKRYNVAASRAKDQLWVVDSLDSANDLKPGDIRKMLIDFSLNPESIHMLNAKIEEKAESPFEASVAKYLAVRGYHLVQQWEVGAYRLDMVAVCGRKKIVIECDGERYHSGEDKIREDMERQTILERLGWRFIRIRGSEYYRNPEKTMERVVKALTDAGIEPEDAGTPQETDGRDTELLQRVKQRAYSILHEDGEVSEVEMSTIAAALDPKNDVIGTILEDPRDLTIPEFLSEVEVKPDPIPNLVSGIELQADEKSDFLPEKEKVHEEQPEVKPGTDYMEVEQMSLLDAQNTEVGQLELFDVENSKLDSSDILEFLNASGVRYVDKRANGGSLWIIGGKELSDVVAKAKVLGYAFHFKKEGGRAIKNQPGWWAK